MKRPHYRWAAFIACAFLAFASSSRSDEPDLETLLDQIIGAYGGEENLRKLNSYVQEWTVVALLGGRHGTDIRLIRIPDQLKVEISYPDKKETRILNGESGFVIYRGMSAHMATQAQVDASRLQLMRHYSPLILRDKLDLLTFEAQGEYRVITLFEHGVRADYFVNADNGRIEKVVGSLAMNGREMQFVTEYSDFAFRDGVLVHAKENKFAGGVNTAMLQLRRITFDAKLSDGDFVPGHGEHERPKQKQEDVIESADI